MNATMKSKKDCSELLRDADPRAVQWMKAIRFKPGTAEHSLHADAQESHSPKVPGSKASTKPARKRNPTGYVHERRPKDGRKHPTKAWKGGKIKVGGLKARCGDMQN